MSRLQRIAPALACAALLWPGAALACAVCIGGQTEETRYAFLWTTGFLSILPLGLVGGLAWWLRRRARELAAREAARAASGPAGRPAQPAAALRSASVLSRNGG